MSPDWDPFTHSALDDPFTAYRLLRDERPIYHNAERDVWALTARGGGEDGLTS